MLSGVAGRRVGTDRGDPAHGEVRLLGPVRLIGPDGPLELPEECTRLLALLALRAGEPVPRAELLAELSGESPAPAPLDGAGLDRACGLLVTALATCGVPYALEIQTDGYRLRLPSHRIDAYQFTRLAARARQRMAAGEFAAAAQLFAAALARWPSPVTGEPLAGLRFRPHGWAAAAVGRLRQARITALEDRWECALRLAVAAHTAAGGPVADRSVVAADLAGSRLAGEAVAELTAAVDRHPSRTRLWDLLLVATFLAVGRRAATEVAERARRVLSRQLGVEPAGRLDALAEAVRRGELPEDWADLAPGPPPTGAVRAPARNPAPPPMPLTALLGRDDLLDVIAHRLTTHRLVTLTGPGGAGKTRLAVAAAHRVTDRPAWFVDLSPVESPIRVPAAVAAALGVPDTGSDVADTLAAELGSVRALLVLDNCEHLVAGAAELVDRLLSHCPELRVLATSRVALGTPGEARVRVPTLGVPPVGAGHSLAELAEHPGTRLFLERAREFSGRPVPETSADEVARLCAELDGLPLAIELAAARTPLLSVPEIASRLRADLRLLRSPDRAAGDRHRSLAAVVESSLAQLDPEARGLFDRLSICPGGFDIEAAQAIGGPGAPAALAALVEASLLEVLPADRAGEPVRYRMLAPIRRHAQHRLVASGAEPVVRRALATYLLGLAERADAGLYGPDRERWLARLRAEAPNLRSALIWLTEAGAGGPAYGDLRMASALAAYCRLEGWYREGYDWLVAALARHPTAPAGLRARAGTAAAMLAMLYCDYPAAVEQAELARRACRSAGERLAEARVEQILGSVARERAQYAESTRHLATAGAIFAECGDERGEAHTVELRGFTAWLAGDLDRAESRLRASLRRYERLDDPVAAASALMNLGAVALYRGDVDRASSLLDIALQRYTELDFPEGLGWAHNLRGLVELRGRRIGRATGHLLASLAAHRQVGDRWRTASVLEALAEVSRLDGEPVRAVRLLGAAARIRDEIGAPVPACERPEVRATEQALRARLAGASGLPAPRDVADDSRTGRPAGPPSFVAAYRDGWSAPLDTLLPQVADRRAPTRSDPAPDRPPAPTHR